MKFGKTIRKLREAKGLNQAELAFRINTSPANLSRIETDRHSPGGELLEALAKEFGYKVYELVAMAEDIDDPKIPAELDEAEKTLVTQFRNMDSKKRQLLAGIATEFAVDGKKTKV